MLVRRLIRVATLGARAYSHAGVSQYAAAISYRVLFSLVPFVALAVVLFDLVLPEDVEQQVVAWIAERVSPAGTDGAAFAAGLERSSPPAGIAGVVSLVLLVWSSGGMMSALRAAFGAIFGGRGERPYLRGKALDVALVLAAGVLMLAAFGLTILSQVVAHVVTIVAGWLGQEGEAASLASRLAQTAGSAGLTFVALAFLFRVLPARRPGWRAAAVGAGVGTVGTTIAADGFGLYLEHAAGFDDIYGPLGAVLAFLLLVYALAIIVLVAACVAACWPASAQPAPPPGPPVSWGERLRGLARSLVVMRPPPPASPHGASAADAALAAEDETYGSRP
jgi:membrane protein